MVIKDFKPVFKRNKQFPIYEALEVNQGQGYILNHFMSASFAVEDMDDGLYCLVDGADYDGEEKPIQKDTYGKFSMVYDKKEAIELDVSAKTLHNDLKRINAFSKEEKVLFFIHSGKARLAFRDGISKCEIEIANTPRELAYFQFISVKLWADAFRVISELTEDVHLWLYKEDPLCRVKSSVEESGFDVFLIGKNSDRKYF